MKLVDPDPIYYRIFFRRRKGGMFSTQPSTVVQGDEERDRILARKIPKAIHFEVAKVHQCSVCSTRGPWEEKWTWFGSYNDIDDGKPVEKFCSPECRQTREASLRKIMESRSGRHLARYEPEIDRTRWETIRTAEEKLNHRKVPMPDVKPGSGTCRWCAKPIFHEKGKKKGQPAPTRSWHTPCYHRYLLFTDRNAQARYLLQRDGFRCGCCGRGGFKARMVIIWFNSEGEDDGWISWKDHRENLFAESEGKEPQNGDLGRCTLLEPSIKLEVDHITPLWKAFDFPIEMRWRLYGPENLWLICCEGQDSCHKVKTRLEAAERAERRRAGG